MLSPFFYHYTLAASTAVDNSPVRDAQSLSLLVAYRD